MQFPLDKETMHSFLGLVNFLNRYAPKLAELCSPLRKLILKDSHYSPCDPEHAAFDAIKAEFKKKIILPYFDRNKETILQTDASKKGFGAVILQAEQPIYYASKALTSAEKNYQNLEREAQAAVWGMEKFHYFLYGRNGRKFRSSISILPSQVLNDRISKQRELIAKKEGKFYASTQDFQIKALPFEAGQNVWLQKV